jgi:hypothetical protein
MDNTSYNSQNPYASPVIPAEAKDASASDSLNTPDKPLVEPIHISGSLSLDDYYIAVRLGRRRLNKLLLVILGILFVLFVIVIYFPERFRGDIGEAVSLAVCLLFYVFLLAIVIYVFFTRSNQIWRKWLARQAYMKGTKPFACTDTIISEDSHEVHMQGVDIKICWSIFKKFRYSDRVALIYFKGASSQFCIFARSKFRTQHDWECFLGLLDRKLPRC